MKNNNQINVESNNEKLNDMIDVKEFISKETQVEIPLQIIDKIDKEIQCSIRKSINKSSEKITDQNILNNIEKTINIDQNDKVCNDKSSTG